MVFKNIVDINNVIWYIIYIKLRHTGYGYYKVVISRNVSLVLANTLSRTIREMFNTEIMSGDWYRVMAVYLIRDIRGFESSDCSDSVPIFNIMAYWCNWLTHRPVTAESTGSSPVYVANHIARKRNGHTLSLMSITLWFQACIDVLDLVKVSLNWGLSVRIRQSVLKRLLNHK